ncbi:MAG TPA: SprT family zinc-dependent metalloprotease [Noviherbaspirillum sp.]|uniref:M48 family metallopeptidase n=1 Tax=Noviherbaspirillum sp. TaxID=1926288 RepID=UPI002B46DFA5|nr:SprT family zinc-dependent metalloprotease [Noviherbaspirillum sp.]HJV84732.1 SprT family zinc-dependent metalloprotease [Noviherbaspirillum sp.]
MKLLRQTPPDPQQLALQLDFFSPEHSSQPKVDQPAPQQAPGSTFVPQRDPLQLTPSPSTPPSPAAPQGRRRIQVGVHILDYRLLRSRRRSIGFLIDDDGLRITAPRWVSVAEIESAIREKQRWIFAKLTERRERSARRLQPHMQWCDGAKLPYLGEDVTLRILAAQSTGIAFDAVARELTVCLPPDSGEQQLKDRVQGWLQAEAKRIFAERLPVYAEKLDVRYQSFALSSAATQWGSCTAEGKIRLNWRLIHFALPMIDYVVAHELSHLREMNHSPRFWATVQSVFPEFQAAKRVLRESGPETLPIF